MRWCAFTGTCCWAQEGVGSPEVTNPCGCTAGWRYDPNYQISEYTFSNFDLTTMTNISNGDRRLWVHLVSCWVISLFVWRVRHFVLSLNC